jgi:ribose 5-phosphate isomerase A
MTSTNAAKKAAGERAATFITDGMRVGLGTGSTTAYALKALGRRVREEGLDIRGVPTSFAAERLARQVGIPLITLGDVGRLDVALDGADEIDDALNLIKGRGAAHTREKVVAAQADRFVILGDPSKRVEQLGTSMPVPVEVLPMAADPVLRALRDLGADSELRMADRKDGPVITDQGFWVIDAHFEGIDDPAALDRALLHTPGVLDHGLFLGLATDVLIGMSDGSVEHLSG